MADSLGLRVEEPRFWDPEQLRAEVDRVFDVCQSCRLCFKFCGSFPSLFEMIDGRTEALRRDYLAAHPEVTFAAAERRRAAEAAPAAPHADEGLEIGVTYGDELPELTAHSRDLSNADVDRVVDLCFQCKLCYPNCPYTPPHEFAIDFPRLLLRWKAQRTRRTGLPALTRLMRDTALVGRLASLAPRLSNWSLRSSFTRGIMEWVTGIDRRKLMPRYHRETFPRWWRRHRPEIESAQAAREGIDAGPLRVALFSSCIVDYNDPGCGKAAVRVLEHNGVEVIWPEGQVCCGMPYLDEGDLETAKRHARQNAELFAAFAERGYAIVVPSPSCSLMIREEYPQVLPTAASAAMATHTYDLNAYLYRIAREGRLKRDFKRRFAKIDYHVPCHIRAQNVGIRGRDLLRLVADEVNAVQECSGHDGTWSMRVENFESSLRWGEKAFDGMRASAGEPCSIGCSDCRLAALHLRQGASRSTIHPVVALAHAYGFEVESEAPLESKPVG